MKVSRHLDYAIRKHGEVFARSKDGQVAWTYLGNGLLFAVNEKKCEEFHACLVESLDANLVDIDKQKTAEALDAVASRLKKELKDVKRIRGQFA